MVSDQPSNTVDEKYSSWQTRYTPQCLEELQIIVRSNVVRRVEDNLNNSEWNYGEDRYSPHGNAAINAEDAIQNSSLR